MLAKIIWSKKTPKKDEKCYINLKSPSDPNLFDWSFVLKVIECIEKNISLVTIESLISNSPYSSIKKGFNFELYLGANKIGDGVIL